VNEPNAEHKCGLRRRVAARPWGGVGCPCCDRPFNYIVRDLQSEEVDLGGTRFAAQWYCPQCKRRFRIVSCARLARPLSLEFLP
jgi:hypothetical protein